MTCNCGNEVFYSQQQLISILKAEIIPELQPLIPEELKGDIMDAEQDQRAERVKRSSNYVYPDSNVSLFVFLAAL